jgi:hypothetical protein
VDSHVEAVAFFDIGNTLGSVRLSPAGAIEELTAYPYVPAVLSELRDFGVRLGVISDRGPIPEEEVNRALAEAGLWSLLTPELVLYGHKDSPRIFEEAAQRAGASGPTGELLFVGEDAAERSQALSAGLLVAPHPHLALSVLEGRGRLRYVRVTVPPTSPAADWQAALRDLPIVPIHVTGTERTTIYGVATAEAATQLDDLGFSVDRLGAEDEPLATDLYLLRDDEQVASGFLRAQGNSADFFQTGPASRCVLSSSDEGLLVAVPAGRSVEAYHFRGARHGHNLKLVPATTLLETIGEGLSPGLVAADPVLRLEPVTLSDGERETLRFRIGPEAIARHVDRYAGVLALEPAGTPIQSRHIHHTDNAQAGDALVRDLERLGAGRFVIRRHRFTHEGRPLENVEAELAGNGLNGIVLITCHMDSTGARQLGYRAALDPAPGADDDASGVAGVLAAAEAIKALGTDVETARRTLRVVFFNAEEHGLVGSRAYARDQAAVAAPIRAVFQMDMIGFDVQPGRSFELHAGFTPSKAVEGRSLALAEVVFEMVPQVSPGLPAPQTYPSDGNADPAESRSDHYSFQLEGYAACLASEDFFAGPGRAAPAPDANPMYHPPTDTVVNASYAADIARLITAAAWVAATR